MPQVSKIPKPTLKSTGNPMKKFWIMAVAATVFAGCAKDTTEDLDILPHDGILRVSIENIDSRVQLAEGNTVWNEDDRVSVFYRTTGNEHWRFTGQNGDTSGTLEKVDGEASDTPIEKIHAIYPHSEVNAVGTDGSFIFPLNAVQEYCEESYGVGNNVMVASSDTEDLSFKNALGWIKVQLTGSDAVKSISLRGNMNEPLAGTVTMNSDLTVADIADAVASVTLECGGITLSEEPTSFYLAVPPQTFEKGITVTVTTTAGESKSQTTDKTISVLRNHIVPMSECGYDNLNNRVPSNQIWYTSWVNKVEKPYKTDGFGANIVSNTCSNGKGVIIFDGPVSAIGNEAFRSCGTIKSVSIPDTVTSIGEYAFDNCDGLTAVTVPANVVSIGDYAFYGCMNLKKIYISDLAAWCNIEFGSNSRGTFYNLYLNGEKVIDLVIPDGITSIKRYAFSYCGSITNVILPDGVTSIGNEAFSGCNNLTDITIPASVTSIGGSVFSGKLNRIHISDLAAWCNMDHNIWNWEITGYMYSLYLDGEEITDLVIPDGVTAIKDCTFYNCDGITSVTIPSSVTSIGRWAFSECNNLERINISDLAAWCNMDVHEYWISKESAYSLYVDGTEITDFVVPEGITAIKDWAFRYCAGLTSVTIPTNVTSIGNYAFSDCTNLERINISDLSAWCGISFESNWISSGCGIYLDGAEIKDLVIPDGVTSISGNAFYNCSGLTSVTIPVSMTSIGSYAFYGCNNLKIYISDLDAWYGVAFGSNWIPGYVLYLNGAEVTDLVIPDGVTVIEDYAYYNCSSYTSVTIPDSVTKIGAVAFRGCTGLTSVTIPDNVTEIGNAAFYGCTGLTSMTIPDGVTSINYNLFYGCSGLTEVSIPDSVTEIGPYAFFNCSSLAGVTIPAGVTTIMESTFGYCSGLISITIPDGVSSIEKNAFYRCTSLTDITIPDSVTSIGDYAFAYCNSLTDITIPYGVISIGSATFGHCPGLKSITIPESVESLGTAAFVDCSNLTNISLPESLTSIGRTVFAECTALTSITIPSRVTWIGSSVFSQCSSLTSIYCRAEVPPALDGDILFSTPSELKIYVPRASVEAYKSALYWKDYAIIGYDF